MKSLRVRKKTSYMEMDNTWQGTANNEVTQIRWRCWLERISIEDLSNEHFVFNLSGELNCYQGARDSCRWFQINENT